MRRPKIQQPVECKVDFTFCELRNTPRLVELEQNHIIWTDALRAIDLRKSFVKLHVPKHATQSKIDSVTAFCRSEGAIQIRLVRGKREQDAIIPVQVVELKSARAIVLALVAENTTELRDQLQACVLELMEGRL